MAWHIRIVVPAIVAVCATLLCMLAVALLAAELEETTNAQFYRELDHNAASFRRQFLGTTQRSLRNAKILVGLIRRGVIPLPPHSIADDIMTPEAERWIAALKGCSVSETISAFVTIWKTLDRVTYGARASPTGPIVVNASGTNPFNNTFWNVDPVSGNLSFQRYRYRDQTRTIQVTMPASMDSGKKAAASGKDPEPNWSEVATDARGNAIFSFMLPLIRPSGDVEAVVVGFINARVLAQTVRGVDYFFMYDNGDGEHYVLSMSTSGVANTAVRPADNVPNPRCQPSLNSPATCFLRLEHINEPRFQQLVASNPEFVRGQGPADVEMSTFLARQVPLNFLQELRQTSTGSFQPVSPFRAIIIVNLTDTHQTTLLTYRRREFDPVGYVAYGIIALVFALAITVPTVFLSLKPVLALPRTLHAASRLRAGGYVKKVSRFSEVASLQHSYNATKHRLDEMMRFLPHYILVRLAAEQQRGSSSGGTAGMSDDDCEEIQETSIIFPALDEYEQRPNGLDLSTKAGASRMVMVVPTNEPGAAPPVVPLAVLLDKTDGAYADSRCTVMYLLLEPPEGRVDEDEEAVLVGFSDRRAFLSSAVAEVTRHGGVVDHLTGRSLTATFNCHTAVARHQEQASLAAINIHRFAAASTTATCPYAVMLDADHAASVTVGTDGARSRLVISRALSVVKKVAPLLLAHGCRVGATERVTSVVPLQHVPLDCVRLTLDCASTGIPSGLEKAERVCELIDSEKTDDFDDSVLFINTAFDEMRTGAFGAAKRHWERAESETYRSGPMAGSYDVRRIRRFIEHCSTEDAHNSGPYCNLEHVPFESWHSEALFAGARPEDVAMSMVRHNLDNAALESVVGSVTTAMGGSYTGAEDPPMFEDSFTNMDVMGNSSPRAGTPQGFFFEFRGPAVGPKTNVGSLTLCPA